MNRQSNKKGLPLILKTLPPLSRFPLIYAKKLRTSHITKRIMWNEIG